NTISDQFPKTRLLGTWRCGYCSAGCPSSSQECLKPVPIEVELCHKAEKACLSGQLTLFFANSCIGEQIASLEGKCRTASRRIERCEKEQSQKAGSVGGSTAAHDVRLHVRQQDSAFRENNLRRRRLESPACY